MLKDARLKKTVAVELFTHGYRVTGTFVLTSRLFAEEIYNPTTAYVVLEDAYLTPITDPATIGRYYKSLVVQKDELDFALTVATKDGLRRDQRYKRSAYKYTVSLTMPFFEITGEIYSMLKKFDPRSYLGTEAGAFISLFNATARSMFDVNVTYQGGVILVNHKHIGSIGERHD